MLKKAKKLISDFSFFLFAFAISFFLKTLYEYKGNILVKKKEY